MGREIQNVQPVWEADVTNLSHHTTVEIKRSAITYTNPSPTQVQTVREIIIPEKRIDNGTAIVQSAFEAVTIQEQRPILVQAVQTVEPQIEQGEVRILVTHYDSSNTIRHFREYLELYWPSQLPLVSSKV